MLSRTYRRLGKWSLKKEWQWPLLDVTSFHRRFCTPSRPPVHHTATSLHAFRDRPLKRLQSRQQRKLLSRVQRHCGDGVCGGHLQRDELLEHILDEVCDLRGVRTWNGVPIDDAARFDEVGESRRSLH